MLVPFLVFYVSLRCIEIKHQQFDYEEIICIDDGTNGHLPDSAGTGNW